MISSFDLPAITFCNLLFLSRLCSVYCRHVSVLVALLLISRDLCFSTHVKSIKQKQSRKYLSPVSVLIDVFPAQSTPEIVHAREYLKAKPS